MRRWALTLYAGAVIVLVANLASPDGELKLRATYAAATSSATQDQQIPSFRAATDAVRVDVSVRQGTRVVTGLTAKDFQVFDNGVLQDVAEISYGRLPIDVTVALDVSFSVTGALLQQLQRAVTQLMRDMRPGDRLKLMMFNMRTSRVVDFTTDVRQVEQAMRTSAAGGGTSLYDTISVAMISAPSADRRQLVVVFTDGIDSNSISDPGSLTDVVHRTNATLTFLVPTGVVPTVVPRAPVPFLVGLAQDTGGAVIFAPRSMDLSTPFQTVLERFRSTYVLHYTPRGVDRTGFHTLQVHVKRDNATVTARRGYFAQ
jgi:VWFA-related protein